MSAAPSFAIALVAMTGCLGRSLATDSARLQVRWEQIDPAYSCDAQAPMMRIRARVMTGDQDDEEIDWVPCVDVEGMRKGLTAPLPLAMYEVTVGMATVVDGPLIATSSAVIIDVNMQRELPYEVDVVFGPPP